MTIKVFGVIFVTAALSARPQDAEGGAAASASGLNMIQKGTQVNHQAELLAEAEVAELKREIAHLKAELAPYRARRSKRRVDTDYYENEAPTEAPSVNEYDPNELIPEFGDYSEEDQLEFNEEWNDIFDEQMAKSGEGGRCGARIFSEMTAYAGSKPTYGDAFVSFQDNCLFGPDAHNTEFCLEGAQALFAGYDYNKEFNAAPNSHFCKMLKNILLSHNFWLSGPDNKGPPQRSNDIPPGGGGEQGGGGQGGGGQGTSFYQEVLNKRIAERAARRQGKESDKLDAAMGSKPAG